MGKLKFYKNKMLQKMMQRTKIKLNKTFFDEYSSECMEKFVEMAKSNRNSVSEETKSSSSDFDINSKVDDFINWYYENMVKGYYTNLGEYHKPIEMRDFIEKMAVWYELRYPDYEINRLMYCSGQQETKIDEVMFKDNTYLNGLIDEISDINYLNWDELYNAKAFINSLPYDEKVYFTKPRYRSLIYINSKYSLNSECECTRVSAHLELSKNGIVIDSDGISSYSKGKITDKEILGKHVNQVINLFNERNINLSKDSELIEMVNYAEKWNYQKEEMLNCVMYRIIERGGNRFGPRRAFLFAKEFDRNIDIPMKYGIDFTDPELRQFMNEYLKAGGNDNLVCYENYFSKTNNNEKLKTITLNEVYKFKNNYTDEEKELYQRMVNTIFNHIDKEKLKESKVKQLRIERKLNKNKK